MAGLKQIMEIFMTINQPLSSEQRVRWYLQRRVEPAWCKNLCKRYSTKPRMALRKQSKLRAGTLVHHSSRRSGRYARRMRRECRPGCRETL